MMPPTRSLPNSLDAETQLLACVFIDSREVLSRCIESDLTPSSFYESKHGAVFSVMLDLHRRDLPVDVVVVAEELKATQQLDRVGGYPFLLTVSSAGTTTAQAVYFIGKVKELHVRRLACRAAEDAAEQCHAGTGAVSETVATIRATFEVLDAQANPMAAQMAARRLNPAVTPPEPRVIYSVGKIPICTAGNISNISAEAKTGKSAFVGAMLAAPMAAEGADCLTVAAENIHGHAVVLLDTEQSAGDWFRILCRAKRRARVEDFPKWLVAYHLTGMSAAECRQGLEVVLAQAHREFGGIFAVFIDGIADLVEDPNDAEACFPFVTRLHALSIKYDTAIINVLHVNPGTAKTRGHLGSQLERKGETNLTLEKDGEGDTVVFSVKQRGASIPKSDGPRFRWSDGEGMHVTAETVRVAKDRAKIDTLTELARQVFGTRRTMPYSDLRKGIETTANCSERTADTRISEMNRLKVITRFPPNLYSFEG